MYLIRLRDRIRLGFDGKVWRASVKRWWIGHEEKTQEAVYSQPALYIDSTPVMRIGADRSITHSETLWLSKEQQLINTGIGSTLQH
jgi:hypothetical protein